MFGFFRKRRYAKLNEKARKMAQARQHETVELRPRGNVDPFYHPDALGQFHERDRHDRRSGLERREHDEAPLVEERRSEGDRRSGEDRRQHPTLVLETNYEGRQVARSHRQADQRLLELEEEVHRLKTPPLDES